MEEYGIRGIRNEGMKGRVRRDGERKFMRSEVLVLTKDKGFLRGIELKIWKRKLNLYITEIFCYAYRY